MYTKCKNEKPVAMHNTQNNTYVSNKKTSESMHGRRNVAENITRSGI